MWAARHYFLGKFRRTNNDLRIQRAGHAHPGEQRAGRPHVGVYLPERRRRSGNLRQYSLPQNLRIHHRRHACQPDLHRYVHLRQFRVGRSAYRLREQNHHVFRHAAGNLRRLQPLVVPRRPALRLFQIRRYEYVYLRRFRQKIIEIAQRHDHNLYLRWRSAPRAENGEQQTHLPV